MDRVRDFVHDTAWPWITDNWTLTGTLGVIGFVLSLIALLRDRAAVRVIWQIHSQAGAGGQLFPMDISIDAINVSRQPVVIRTVGFRSHGNKGLDFSGTAEGPARPKRLDTNDVATWKLSISWLREQGIADAEDLCAIVVIYVRRRWWRRQPGRDSKEFISDRIDVGMENVNKQAKRQFKNPTTSTPIRGRITIVPDESESSDDRDPASEGELPPVR